MAELITEIVEMISKDYMRNDEALLDLIKKLMEQVVVLENRVNKLEVSKW